MKQKHSENGHVWRFFRAGGFDQVRLDTGKDLANLDKLDQKLWVALACSIDNVHFDARTLTLIDSDGDRRVRAAELISAIQWTVSLLKNPDDLVASKDSLLSEQINDASEEGKKIALAARNALKVIGKLENDALTVSDTEGLEKAFSQHTFNGDGIITEAAMSDTAMRDLFTAIVASCGSVPDRSGKPGINAEKIEMFFNRCKSYVDWMAEGRQDPILRPLHDKTKEAAEAIAEVQKKIDDYFARCEVAKFDNKAIEILNAGENDFADASSAMLSLESDKIARLPLAKITATSSLFLTDAINPAWKEKIEQFRRTVIQPLLGTKETLSHAEWKNILSIFSPWFAWQEKKPAGNLDSITLTKIDEWLQSSAQDALMKLIELDSAELQTFDSLTNLEKLIRFRRDLYPLCTNFVNFKDFYAKGGPAIFQVGTLYLDQRTCNLCIKVEDANKHALMAAMAGTFLVYCDCRRRAGEERMTIVAAFTNGDSDNLIIGRNGIFYDRAGKDWDATIIKIIENPISIRQAFWLPYKSLVKMIESQVAKRATTADAQSNDKLNQTAAATANIENSKPSAAPKKLDIGVVAALGVAAGALGTFIATFFGYAGGVIKLGPLAITGALIGIILLISGPSLCLAYIKLRKRNLGPILDAGGWAVNAKAKINVPFGSMLTQIATLPPGAQRDLADPYAEKKSPWPKLIIIAIIVYSIYTALDHLGFVNEWTAGRIGIIHAKVEKTTPFEKKNLAIPQQSSPQEESK